MAATNTILTPDMITQEGLVVLESQLNFTKGVNRDYDDSFAKSGAKIGDSLRIRLPNRYTVRTGKAVSIQNTVENKVDLSVQTQIGIDLDFSSAELTMDIDNFSKRIIFPAVSRLAAEVDVLGLDNAYKTTYNYAGTAGTDPATLLVYLQAQRKLDDFLAPMDGYRYACINPAAQVATVDGLKGLFNATDEVSKQYRTGYMGKTAGLMFGMDQNIARHTTGAFAGTVLVNDTVVEGDAVISMDAFTDAAPTLKEGDKFTIAGVNAVNPQTGVDLGVLQQFVVRADKTGSGNAAADVSILPAMKASASDPTRTIASLPADNAVITFLGAASSIYAMNIVHHKDAYTLATADLEMPRGMDDTARENYKGISMRYVRGFDINNDVFISRLDILLGWGTLRGEHGVVVIGA